MGNSAIDNVSVIPKKNTTLDFIISELKPKGKILTPFNIITLPIIIIGLVLVVIRFVSGLGAVSNLSQEYPWGIWIGFDVMTGVAFAGGAYTVTFMVYILGMKKYKPIVRATVLNGLLAYMFYAGALLIDCGRPWNAINPFIGNSFGVSSVMFLIAWHFMLYMVACMVEFSPVVAEWLGKWKIKKILKGMTLAAVIFGITLSTLHQSGLGALFLMAKPKIHPLWYSEFLPILFFVSSIFAGLSMVIFEGTISHRVFRKLLSPEHRSSHGPIVLGLSKICAITMFVYIFMKTLVFFHEQNFSLLMTPMGLWWLVEVIGFVVLPMVLFIYGYKKLNRMSIKIAAVLTLLGIILNRLNVSVIAFKWYSPNRYFPSIEEILITAMVVLAEIWIFRWVARRMAIFNDPPRVAIYQPASK